MKISLAIVPLALVASPALSAPDARLRSVHYQANQVVSVQGRLGFQSMIEFAPGEEIENVAVGGAGCVAGVVEGNRLDGGVVSGRIGRAAQRQYAGCRVVR